MKTFLLSLILTIFCGGGSLVSGLGAFGAYALGNKEEAQNFSIALVTFLVTGGVSGTVCAKKVKKSYDNGDLDRFI